MGGAFFHIFLQVFTSVLLSVHNLDIMKEKMNPYLLVGWLVGWLVLSIAGLVTKVNLFSKRSYGLNKVLLLNNNHLQATKASINNS